MNDTIDKNKFRHMTQEEAEEHARMYTALFSKYEPAFRTSPFAAYAGKYVTVTSRSILPVSGWFIREIGSFVQLVGVELGNLDSSSPRRYDEVMLRTDDILMISRGATVTVETKEEKTK